MFRNLTVAVASVSLALASVASSPVSATEHPTSPGPVGEYVADPPPKDLVGVNASYNYGWVTGTLYLNRSETLMVTSGSGAVVAACGLMPTPVNAVCAAAILTFSGTAGYAYANDGCLKIKHAATTIWPDTHYGDRCT